MKKNFSILRSMIEVLKRDSLGLFLLMIVFILMTITMCKLYNDEHKDNIKKQQYIYYLESSLYPEQVENLTNSEFFKDSSKHK